MYVFPMQNFIFFLWYSPKSYTSLPQRISTGIDVINAILYDSKSRDTIDQLSETALKDCIDSLVILTKDLITLANKSTISASAFGSSSAQTLEDIDNNAGNTVEENTEAEDDSEAAELIPLYADKIKTSAGNVIYCYYMQLLLFYSYKCF